MIKPVLPPCLLFVGDPFLCEEGYKQALQTAEKAFPEQVTIYSYRLSETDFEAILGQAKSFSLLTQFQIFRIREADLIKKEQAEYLASYLSQPQGLVCMIFETESVKSDESLVQLVQKHGKVQRFETGQRRSSVEQMIKNRLRESGKTIHPEALERIKSQMGEAPMFLQAVMDQLITFTGDKKEIDEAAVRHFEENWQTLDVFQLADALAAGQTGRSLQLLERLLADSETDSYALAGMLHWQMKRFWKVRVLMDAGQSQEAALQQCRIKPNQAPFFLKQLKMFSRAKLEKMIEDLFQLDWKVKTGQAQQEPGLESWVISAASPR